MTADEECVVEILVYLKVITQEDKVTMNIKEKKDVLKQYIRKYLNDEYYTKTKLKFL